MTRITTIISDSMRRVADSLTTATEGFPYIRPSSTDGSASSLFQQNISDDDLFYMYSRNPLAKVIINDVAEDVFDKGFLITNLDYDELAEEQNETTDDDLNTKFTNYFDNVLRQPFIHAYKLARLRGYSLLLMGFNDGLPLYKPPAAGAKIKFYQPIDSVWIEDIVYETNSDDEMTLPITIKWYKMTDNTVASKYIHPQRVIHIENPGIEMLKLGASALTPCFDDLTVLTHVTWGAGQTMWRSGNQLVTAIAPPRASAAQMDAMDDALTDVNAQTALVLPYGTDVTTHSPVGLNPSPYADIPINNISAATRIPLSILIGSQAGALASSLTDARDYAGTLSGIQNNVITQALTKIFQLLQYSKQLPYKKFKIVWNPTLTMSKPEETLVEYREALTARINNEIEAEAQEARDQRDGQGGTGPLPPTAIEQATNTTPSPELPEVSAV